MEDNTLTVFEFKNLKQTEFYTDVMKSAGRLPGFDFRYMFYGGAIRGGKTFVCLLIFWILARTYPNSRWHVFREDNPALESTTIPSMEKLIGTKGKDFVWKRGKGSVHIALSNGSKIFFKSENISQDPELKELLGLETNGIMLEQMEALSETLFNMAIQRVGSWYIDPMPIPLILGTFNPTQTWVKKKIYDPYVRGELASPYYFKMALPEDNPFVTQDQWNNWANLDGDNYLQMIKGVWQFTTNGNLFAYSFNPDIHVKSAKDQMMQIDRRLPLYLIFDFNVDPMTCLVAQRDGINWGKVLAEYRLRTSDIFELLERIKIDYADYFIIATGDASGRNRTAITKGNKSYVDIIRTELRLSAPRVQFPTVNPSIRNTRVLMNSIFNKHGRFWISDACLWLIDDLNTVKTDSAGGIDKKNTDPTKTHLLDNLRYFMWNYFRTFVKI